MNYPQSRHLARALPAEADPGEELDLLRLLGTLVDARWLIACTTVLALLAGGAYAFLSPPVYEANTLIQVEENAPGAEAALVDAASLFDVRSPASAEMEILRSRMVVGGAVERPGVPCRVPLCPVARRGVPVSWGVRGCLRARPRWCVARGDA